MDTTGNTYIVKCQVSIASPAPCSHYIPNDCNCYKLQSKILRIKNNISKALKVVLIHAKCTVNGNLSLAHAKNF